jgi:hydrogenase expression/formation protein HypC
MCIAIPSRILSIDERGCAVVESFGVRREVSVALLEEAIAIGDYVLVRAGGYACERIEEERALDTLSLLAQLEPDLAEMAVS